MKGVFDSLSVFGFVISSVLVLLVVLYLTYCNSFYYSRTSFKLFLLNDYYGDCEQKVCCSSREEEASTAEEGRAMGVAKKSRLQIE